MGLDAYLYRREPDVSWEDYDNKGIEEIAYFRKFNALHQWVQDKLNNGEPHNVTYIEMSFDQMIELLATCQRVLTGEVQPSEALPTASGFFFGDLDYGDWYQQHVMDLVEVLVKALDEERVRVTGGLEPRQYAYYSWW